LELRGSAFGTDEGTSVIGEMVTVLLFDRLGEGRYKKERAIFD
jgi:hypothetical protein